MLPFILVEYIYICFIFPRTLYKVTAQHQIKKRYFYCKWKLLKIDDCNLIHYLKSIQGNNKNNLILIPTSVYIHTYIHIPTSVKVNLKKFNFSKN